MKYAIVQTSGKQFVFIPDRWYDMDLIKKGKFRGFIGLNKVLLFKKSTQLQLGKPFLPNSAVLAKIVETIKGKKFKTLKTKPKKNYTRIKGHRQKYSRVQLIS